MIHCNNVKSTRITNWESLIFVNNQNKILRFWYTLTINLQTKVKIRPGAWHIIGVVFVMRLDAVIDFAPILVVNTLKVVFVYFLYKIQRHFRVICKVSATFLKVKCWCFSLGGFSLELRTFATSNIKRRCLAMITILLRFEKAKKMRILCQCMPMDR